MHQSLNTFLPYNRAIHYINFDGTKYFTLIRHSQAGVNKFGREAPRSPGSHRYTPISIKDRDYIPAFKTHTEALDFMSKLQKSDDSNYLCYSVMVIDVDTLAGLDDNKIATPFLFGPRSETKSVISRWIGSGLFESNYKYPKTYCNLLKDFDPSPDSHSNALPIKHLFYDYWDKGTGFKQFLFFHMGRNHTNLAKQLVDYLDKNQKASNEEVLDKICELYNQAKSQPKFNTKGSFATRCNFAVLQLTNGYCDKIEDYLQQRLDQSASPRS